jgi:hypothetical protein
VCTEIYGLLKPELEASLEVSFGDLKFELSSTIAASGA